jgi:hypothetical protein
LKLFTYFVFFGVWLKQENLLHSTKLCIFFFNLLSPTGSTILGRCWVGSTKVAGKGFWGGIFTFHYTFCCSCLTNFCILQFNFIYTFWICRPLTQKEVWKWISMKLNLCHHSPLLSTCYPIFFSNKLAPSSCLIYSCELLERWPNSNMTLLTHEVGLTIGPSSQLEEVLQVQMEHKVKTFEVWRGIWFIPKLRLEWTFSFVAWFPCLLWG